MTTPTSIEINGTTYVAINQIQVPSPAPTRAVIVVDRGWIFAGDVTRENGRIKLSRCVWVFCWKSCGFSAVIDDPSKADIRKHADVDIPESAEIFSVPVSSDWGL